MHKRALYLQIVPDGKHLIRNAHIMGIAVMSSVRRTWNHALTLRKPRVSAYIVSQNALALGP